MLDLYTFYNEYLVNKLEVRIFIITLECKLSTFATKNTQSLKINTLKKYLSRFFKSYIRSFLRNEFYRNTR